MSKTLKVTDDTETYINQLASEGLWSWIQGGGLNVSQSAKDCMELLHIVAAGGTISTSRQGGDIISITVTDDGDDQIRENLQELFNDALASHDEIEEQDGFVP